MDCGRAFGPSPADDLLRRLGPRLSHLQGYGLAVIIMINESAFDI